MKITLKNLKSEKYSWIQNTELYKNLIEDEDDDEELEIQYLCTPKCLDIDLLIKTIDYWDIKILYSNVFDMILEHKEEILDILVNWYCEGKSENIKFLIDICNADENEIFEIAYKYSRVDCIPFLHKFGLKCNFNSKIDSSIFPEKCFSSFEEISNFEDEHYLKSIDKILSNTHESYYMKVFFQLISSINQIFLKKINKKSLINP